MSKVELLPATAAEWKEEFKTCKLIPLDFLNDSEELASGSKFEYDHFLRMRILYLFEDQIPKNLRPRLENIFPQHVRDEVEKTFQEDHDIGYMASFLELSKRIKEEWPKENPRAAGFFAIALAKLHQLCVKDVITFSGLSSSSSRG